MRKTLNAHLESFVIESLFGITFAYPVVLVVVTQDSQGAWHILYHLPLPLHHTHILTITIIVLGTATAKEVQFAKADSAVAKMEEHLHRAEA